MTFTKNVGPRDAQLRIVVSGVVIVVAMFLVDNPWLRIVLALVSATLATSAYFHSCYLYKLLGLHTLEGKVTHTNAPAPETMPVMEEEKPEAVPAAESEKTV